MNSIHTIPFEEIVTSEIHDLGSVAVYLISPGIMVSYYYEDIVLDLSLAKKINQIAEVIGGGKALPQLFIACPGQGVTKEVREWSAIEANNDFTICTAVVCNSLAHRILGNFFIRIQRPPRPTRMFQEFDPAKEWLISQMQ